MILLRIMKSRYLSTNKNGNYGLSFVKVINGNHYVVVLLRVDNDKIILTRNINQILHKIIMSRVVYLLYNLDFTQVISPM